MYSHLTENIADVHVSKQHDFDVTVVKQIQNVYNLGDPRSKDIFQDLSTFLLVSYIIGLILFALIIIKFILFIPSILENTPKRHVSRTLILCGIYTIVAASSLTSMLVPRVLLFCESVNVVTFGLCAYQFFCLYVDYAGGESNFIRVVDKVKVLNMRTPPCCCCCCFINPIHINKLNFTNIRLLILQLPVGLGLVYFMLNVVYLEDSSLYNQISFYFMPFIGISVLFGIWGLQMSSRMFAPFFFGIQNNVAQIEFSINGSQSTEYPITRKVFSKVIVQLLILIECVLLSFWAHQLYNTSSKVKDEKNEST